jgi:16S rRNA (cytosine967-C5)-methyltransferase
MVSMTLLIFASNLKLFTTRNVPEWMYRELMDFYGPEKFSREMAALDQEAPIDLRVNTLRSTRDRMEEILNAAGVKVTKTPFSPYGLRTARGSPLSQNESFKKGGVYIQDEGSQLVSVLAQAKPGSYVLDYCAGAGGKTLGMAMDMQNKGRIYATDVSEVRLAGAKRYLIILLLLKV